MSQQPFDVEEEVRRIDAKRALLAYLRSPPKHFTIENYMCLARILTQAGWRFDDSLWHKDTHHLAAIEAAIIELEAQIAADKDRVLRHTVRNYQKPQGDHDTPKRP